MATTKRKRAKNYIYRNLNCGGFSSKCRGKVQGRFAKVGYPVAFAMVDGFRVSETVRQKIVAGGKKQVHAYIVVDMYFQSDARFDLDNHPQVKYNPRTDTFFHVTDGTPIDDVKFVVFQDEKVYAFTIDSLKANTTVRNHLIETLDAFWPPNGDKTDAE